MVLGCRKCTGARRRPALLHPDMHDVGNTGEKALPDCKAQLHILRQRLVKQRTVVSNVKGANDRSQEKLDAWEGEAAKLELRYGELSVDPLTPSSSKVASEVGDGPQFDEVHSNDGGMDLTGQFDGPDPPEPPAGSPSPGPDRPPPPLPPAPCRMRMPPNGVVLRRRSRTIRCLPAVENGQLSWCTAYFWSVLVV